MSLPSFKGKFHAFYSGRFCGGKREVDCDNKSLTVGFQAPPPERSPAAPALKVSATVLCKWITMGTLKEIKTFSKNPVACQPLCGLLGNLY